MVLSFLVGPHNLVNVIFKREQKKLDHLWRERKVGFSLNLAKFSIEILHFPSILA